jgi:hypothetical protein
MITFVPVDIPVFSSGSLTIGRIYRYLAATGRQSSSRITSGPASMLYHLTLCLRSFLRNNEASSRLFHASMSKHDSQHHFHSKSTYRNRQVLLLIFWLKQHSSTFSMRSFSNMKSSNTRSLLLFQTIRSTLCLQSRHSAPFSLFINKLCNPCDLRLASTCLKDTPFRCFPTNAEENEDRLENFPNIMSKRT